MKSTFDSACPSGNHMIDCKWTEWESKEDCEADTDEEYEEE